MRSLKTDNVALVGLFCSLVLLQVTWATAADCDNECRARTTFLSDGPNGQTCTTYSKPDCEKCVQTLSQCKGPVDGTECLESETVTVQIKFQSNCPIICALVAGGITQAGPGINLSPWSDPLPIHTCFI